MDLLTKMACVYVVRNTVTCNAAYSACEKAKGWLRVVELLGEMDDVRAEQCNITYSTAMVQAGAWLRAMEPLAEMACGHAAQDTISHSAAICACAKGSDWSRDVDRLIMTAGGGW